MGLVWQAQERGREKGNPCERSEGEGKRKLPFPLSLGRTQFPFPFLVPATQATVGQATNPVCLKEYFLRITFSLKQNCMLG